MLEWVLTRRIDTDRFITVVSVVALIVLIVLIVRRPYVRSIVVAASAAAGGALIGLLLAWLLSDVYNVFGIDLTVTTRTWVALAFAGVAVALAETWRARWWRIVLAVLCVPVVLVAGAAGVNADFGAYRTLNDALGRNPYGTVAAATLHGHAHPASDVANWHPPANMPKTGLVESVTIPGTVSHFNARQAVIYLPPAARVAKPPALPVILSLSGQPGQPSSMFVGGNVASTLNAYAAKHHGLAPILVAPDQLGASQNNPMCVNSPLGNAATYITVDVVHWIKSHLNVIDSPRDWAVLGFSEGATCAMQFGAARPDLFDTIIAAASELVPWAGPSTVAKGFGGSQAAYDAAKPVSIMKRMAPYRHSTVYFGVGQDDPVYRKCEVALQAAAERAGMKTRLFMSPGTAHDWHTVQYLLNRAIPLASDAWGLDR